MNEVTEEVLREVLAYVEAAAEFSAEQAPLLAQEIVRFALFEGVIQVLLAALLGTYVVWWYGKFSEWSVREGRSSEAEDAKHIIGTVLAVLSILFGAILLFTGLVQAAKAIAAPRLVVLDALRGML